MELGILAVWAKGKVRRMSRKQEEPLKHLSAVSGLEICTKSLEKGVITLSAKVI